MINLISKGSTKTINVNDLDAVRVRPDISNRERSREDILTHAQILLIKFLHFNVEETEKVGDKYGYYGGMVQFLLRELHLTHEEAYEQGILNYPRPADRCDEKRKKILDEYRRIRIEQGIRKANQYFTKTDEELREYEKTYGRE